MVAFDLPKWSPDLTALESAKRGEKWAQRALESEAQIVARAMNGTRNNTLNNAAVKLGHKVAAGYLDPSEVEAALLQAAQANGLASESGADAALATIRSGLAKGMEEPQHPEDRPDYRRAPSLIVPQPERTSRFYSAADLDGRAVPARKWLVEGLVPQKNVTLFSGDGGTGKSLAALQMAVSTATGRAWLNIPVPKGRALFLSAEDDDDELHIRLDAIRRQMRLEWSDLGGLTLRSLAGEDALLAVETKIALMQTALFDEIEARAKDDQPSLIVLDTLADLFPANENDRAAVRQFIGILRGLALRQKCAVLLLGHPSLTGLSSGSGTSGSTAWNNSVRSRLYLERIVQDGYEPDPDKRVLSTKKANYGRIGGEMTLTWTEGVFLRDAEPQGLDALAAGAKGERVFLSLLREVTMQGRRVNAAGGLNYAPKVFADHPEAEGCTKKALRSAMEKLLASGKVKVVHGGSPSRPVTWLEAAE
ncbi:AAA family ATPase [Paracoccus spongiarum]|uniref:AAA family ATPase n=1 Tax=Paracoccus spongiarum TaxID=3064387 RepID=A0ABT9JGG5_9RHOB|nr:AAA family ATPase [Paracoccus sp. 2205BS29-5]MDP5308869.1 AAA family ATPase [Paracoccus sp. 2205BS29-5]